MGGYRFLGTRTNNEAEYGGLILALEDALESGFGKIHVKSDSKLIVSQVNGDWNVKNPNLQALLDKVIGLIARLEHFSIEHIPREENSEADRQCNLCLDEYELDIRDDPTGFFS
jgi:ribonuclease HI